MSGAWKAALALSLLAPAFGELLSTSSPPHKFFNPGVFLILWALYGAGALLVREGALLFGGGWHRILLLGAAYGVVEEGLVCRSFFDPGWKDLGPLAHYGRLAGTNWVWTVHLTLFHTFISIAAPILVVDLLWPRWRGKLITSRWWRVAIAVPFAVDVLLMGPLLTKYLPSDALLLGAELAVAALVVLAWRWPALRAPQPEQAPATPPRPAALWALGFFGTAVFFLLMYGSPGLHVPWPAEIAVVLALLALVMTWLYSRTGGGKAWGDLHRFGLVAGMLSTMAVLDFLVSLPHPNGTSDKPGMGLVGLAVIVGLFLLGRLLRRREAAVAAPKPPDASAAAD